MSCVGLEWVALGWIGLGWVGLVVLVCEVKLKLVDVYTSQNFHTSV